MVILKYVCGTFSRTIDEGVFVSIISAFAEKAAHEQKFGIVIPVRTDIFTKTEK